ncbi:hypothetical protein AB0L47_24940 [Streptomyces bobili]|uniref:hypothetical protein n=1 Tax=Streptomyces bobili TaxID=67280 RepID=UPI003442A985
MPGTKMLLADISESSWRAALGRRTADQSSLMPHWIPQLPGEAEHTATQDAELAGACAHLCATLRRIRLVDALTRGSGHVHLFTTRHHGDLHLIEACEATPHRPAVVDLPVRAPGAVARRLDTRPGPRGTRALLCSTSSPRSNPPMPPPAQPTTAPPAPCATSPA